MSLCVKLLMHISVSVYIECLGRMSSLILVCVWVCVCVCVCYIHFGLCVYFGVCEMPRELCSYQCLCITTAHDTELPVDACVCLHGSDAAEGENAVFGTDPIMCKLTQWGKSHG